MSKQDTTSTPAANELSDDLFDPAKLRVTGDAFSAIGVEKLLMTVPVRRPNKQEFFRIHPGPDYRLAVRRTWGSRFSVDWPATTHFSAALG